MSKTVERVILVAVMILSGGVYYFLLQNQPKEISLTEPPVRTISIKKLDALDFSKYKSFGAVNFSRNGKHVFYIANINENPGLFEGKVIIDGKESSCSLLQPINFSPIDERVICGPETAELKDKDQQPQSIKSEKAHKLQKGNKEIMIIDGVEGKEYGKVFEPAISPNDRYVAYVARQGTDYFVVFNDQESKPYAVIEGSLAGSPEVIFSPDSSKFAYVARIKDKVHYNGRETGILLDTVVINGQEGQRYSNISNLSFGADGQSLSYGAVATVGENNVLKDNDILWVTETLN